MMAHTLLAMLALAVGVRGDDGVCAGGTAACAVGCVCHNAVCDSLQTCTPGELTAYSTESSARTLAQCGTCDSHPAIGFIVDTGWGSDIGDGVYGAMQGASCNNKIVYGATHRLVRENGRWEVKEKSSRTFLFQPTGTQHWRISNEYTCSDKGYFVSSEDCAGSPETLREDPTSGLVEGPMGCSSWQSGSWWMSEEPDMLVITSFARAGCSSHSDCATAEYCDEYGTCYECRHVERDPASRCDAIHEDGESPDCCTTDFLVQCKHQAISSFCSTGEVEEESSVDGELTELEDDLADGLAEAAASMFVPALGTVQADAVTTTHDPLLVGLASVSALVALLAASAAVHYRRKAIAAAADAKPLQEGEEREENVARDSTAETATLAGKSMKQTSDASYP